MLLDCGSCTSRTRHCADCVVPAVLTLSAFEDPEGAGPTVPLDLHESRAVAAFVDQGLVGVAQARALRALTPQRRSAAGAARAAG